MAFSIKGEKPRSVSSLSSNGLSEMWRAVWHRKNGDVVCFCADHEIFAVFVVTVIALGGVVITQIDSRVVT